MGFPEPSSNATSATPAAAIPAGGIGLRGRGFNVPAGSLDQWRAARAAATATLAEVLCVGDSLTRGQTPSSVYFSFVQQLRRRAAAAGFADGGRGYNETSLGDSLDGYTGEVAPISAKSGWAASATWGVPNAQYSITGGDTITFKVQAPRARLWWSRYLQGGRFSYTVNGGAAVTVNAGYIDAPPRGAGTGATGQNPEVILLTAADGMLGGGATNTIVVTNLGGNPTSTPVLLASGGGTGETGTAGNVPAGTFYYVATHVAAPGETVKSNVAGPYVVAGSHTVEVRLLGTGWTGTFNLYRSTSSGGPFEYVGQITGVQSFVNSPVLTDNTAVPSAGVNPPASSTAGLDPSFSNVAVNIEAINATGIVFHNHGISGATIGSFVDIDDLFYNSNNFLAMLGVQWGATVPTANGISVATPADVLPAAANSGTTFPVDPTTGRKPKLVILAFGTNDMRVDWNIDTPGAPVPAVGPVGALAAATYYYKVKRVLTNTILGPASAASSGVAVDGSHQMAVTMPSPTVGSGFPPVWNVYRSTTSGGTYSYVGQAIGYGSVLLDNVAAAGSAMPADVTTVTTGHFVLTDFVVMSLSLAVQIIRNSGADPMILLPTAELLAMGTNLRGVTHKIKDAFRTVADTYSVPWVDMDEALGPAAGRLAAGYTSTFTNPHIPKAAYVQWGNFIWDNVLSL